MKQRIVLIFAISMTLAVAAGIAKLYSYYKEFGTLLGGAKYINLRDPQETIPRPTDKY